MNNFENFLKDNNNNDFITVYDKERIYNDFCENKNNKLLELRILYLLKRITKEKFKQELQIIYKTLEVEKKYMDVWKLLRILLIEYIMDISDINNKSIFLKLTRELIKSKQKINNEYYLDMVFKVAVDRKENVKNINVKSYFSWGTPEELVKWKKKFEKKITI